jgi:hypothetical protein
VSAEDAVPADPVASEVGHETERRLASGIYGLIVASSVLAAGVDDDSIGHVAVSVLVTLVVYWLAETYAHAMAARHVRGERVDWTHTRRDLRTGWPLVSASFTPLISVVFAAVLGASVGTAQTVGLICATVLLFSSGWVAGRRRGLTGVRLLPGAVVAASFGVALIALKTALH